MPTFSNRPWLLLGCLLVAMLVAGIVGRQYFFQWAARPADSAPLPRPRINAPFITTPDAVVERMVELADISPDDLVYDLGCGDGRLAITAAHRTGCRSVGFDIDPQRVREARDNVRLHGVEDRVEIVEQDVFTVYLGDADVILMYLLPWMVEKLRPQFDRMRPGSRIVSHDFWIEGAEPEQVVECPHDEFGQVQRIFVYTTPLRERPESQKNRPPQPDEAAPG